MKLAELRRQIDRLDREIVQLLNARTKVAMRIGRLKHAAGVAIFVPERERQVYARVEKASRGPLTAAQLQHIYREIMSAARSMEGDMRVAYVPASAVAARAKFGHSIGYVRCASVAAAGKAVRDGRAHLAVVPARARPVGLCLDRIQRDGAVFDVIGPGEAT